MAISMQMDELSSVLAIKPGDGFGEGYWIPPYRDCLQLGAGNVPGSKWVVLRSSMRGPGWWRQQGHGWWLGFAD